MMGAILYVVLFFVAIGFAVYYRDQPKVMSGVLGGSFVSLSGLILGLRSLWRQKAAVDFMLYAIPSLSPQEVINLAKAMYFADLKAPPKRNGKASGK